MDGGEAIRWHVSEPWDIAIVGAGAAGMAAGIFAKEANPAARVALFDGAHKPGAKILVAGGGRCNVTHFQVRPEDYNALSRNFVKNVLASFTADDTVKWLATLGVTLKREPTGKLFPTTDKARTVLDALLNRLKTLEVPLFAGIRIIAARREIDGFILTDTAGNLHRARRLILATGGRSLPKTGSDGGGYDLVRSLGHTVTETHPALVSMVLQQHFFHAGLAGISHEAEITTLADGKVVDRRAGALLWTHFGISGPVVMDASRHWLVHKSLGKEVKWLVSVVAGERFDTLEPAFVQLASEVPRMVARKAMETLFPGIPEKLMLSMLAAAGVHSETQLAQLKRDDRRALVHALTALPLPVEQDRGWNHAEVTAGGVPLEEISWKTMESRLVPGLHLAGEIVDLDGRIGGFNFQWAWATGHLAGRAAAG